MIYPNLKNFYHSVWNIPVEWHLLLDISVETLQMFKLLYYLNSFIFLETHKLEAFYC